MPNAHPVWAAIMIVVEGVIIYALLVYAPAAAL